MIRTLFKLALFLVLALVGYNYFFGTVEEKEQSREIVGKVGDLGRDAWNLLRGEREKLRAGKYDEALDNLDNLYGKLSERAEDLKDSGLIQDVHELRQRRADLEDMLRQNGGEELTPEGERKLEELTAETEDVMNEMEAKGQPGAPY